MFVCMFIIIAIILQQWFWQNGKKGRCSEVERAGKLFGWKSTSNEFGSLGSTV